MSARHDETGLLRHWSGDRSPRLALLAAATAGFAALIAIIGLVDYASGDELSLGAFYLVPVVGAVLVVGPSIGYAAALTAAVVWTVAEFVVRDGDSLPLAVWNVVIRFGTLAVVVYLIAALRAATASARASDRASREFLATAAHQLRTPVAGLVALADAMRTATDDGQRQELAHTLGSATERVRRLLSMLLELSRLDQAEEAARRVVDVRAVVEREIELLRLRCGSLDTSIAAHGDAVVLAAPDAVREAVANVVDNAGRHATSRVAVNISRADSVIRIDVLDDGGGVAPGQSERIFERFVSMDGEGGAGLGLAIARGLARSQGGDVTVIAGGFRIALPAVE